MFYFLSHLTLKFVKTFISFSVSFNVRLEKHSFKLGFIVKECL